MSLRCIFCGVPDPQTDEHVIPSSLGGDLVIRNGSCERCNCRCSHDFEAKFVNDLRPIRHLLGISNRSDDVPSVAVNFDLRGKESTGMLTADFDLRPSDTVIEGATDDETEYWMFTKRGRRKLENHAQRTRKKIIPLEDGNQPVRVQPRTSIPLNFITEFSAKRTVGKIAYTYATHVLGRVALESSQYDDFRRFLRDGDDSHSVRLFYSSEFLEAGKLTAFQHAVILASDAERHTVTAIVVLFGGLTYTVRLAANAVLDVGSTYLWDARERRPVGFFVRDYFHELAGVRMVEADATEFENVLPVVEYWKELLEVAGRYRMAKANRASDCSPNG